MDSSENQPKPDIQERQSTVSDKSRPTYTPAELVHAGTTIIFSGGVVGLCLWGLFGLLEGVLKNPAILLGSGIAALVLLVVLFFFGRNVYRASIMLLRFMRNPTPKQTVRTIAPIRTTKSVTEELLVANNGILIMILLVLGVCSTRADLRPGMFGVVIVMVVVLAFRFLYTKTMQCIANYKFPEAIRLAEIQVGFNPRFAYYALCVASLGMRRADTALKYSNKLLELTPEVPDYFAYRASARILARQFEEADQDCSEALKRDPNCLAALINKAEIHLRLARPDDAIVEICQAESLPNLPAMIKAHLHCNIALARLLLGQQAAAKEAANSAMAADKKSSAAHFAVALCLLKEKSYDLALEQFTESINIDPYLAEAFGYRHQLYLETVQLELADADKARAAELGFEPYPGL